jgi:hypothetical protein
MAVNRMVPTPQRHSIGRKHRVENNLLSIVPSIAGGTALQCICT